MKLPSISLNSLQEWKELKRFQELDEKNKSIVFYSENEFYTIHFEKLIKELTNIHHLTICYVTLACHHPYLQSMTTAPMQYPPNNPCYP